MVIGHEVSIRRLRCGVQIVWLRGGKRSGEGVKSRSGWSLRHDRIDGPGRERVGKNTRAAANHRRPGSAARRPRESDLWLSHNSRHGRKCCVLPGADRLVDRQCSVHLSQSTGKPLEAVGLADRVGKMIQAQAERQFQIVGNSHIVGAIETYLIERDRLVGLLREVLRDYVAGAAPAAGDKVAESEFNHLGSNHLKGVIADVVAAVVYSDFEVVPSSYPTEVVDYLVLGDASALRKEEIQAVQRIQRSIIEC